MFSKGVEKSETRSNNEVNSSLTLESLEILKQLLSFVTRIVKKESFHS